MNQDNTSLTENGNHFKKTAFAVFAIFSLLNVFGYFWNREVGDISIMSDFSDSFYDENNLQPDLPEGLKPEKPSGSSYWYYPTAVLTKEILSRSRIIT
ncbi:MAG TPA: hypothetical protein PLG41_03545 [Leptospiraceae bacterium]|nr:hypothetical protein [Leptospiraceae bacterium]